ncbi:MAG: glycosyltransferase family A protein [Patescibacteria group bacterium]
MPKVSVLLPVYNGADYLQYAIESILAQTFLDYEFIIVNDGSTDTSEEIIQHYSDARIRYLTQQNVGLTLTLNRLIREARGELLARMDQDDWSHPERLQTQVQFMNRNPHVKMCGTWIQAMNTKNQPMYTFHYPVTNHAIHEELLLSNPFAHGSVVIRKTDNIFYRPEYDNAEDIDNWARQCMQHEVANIPKTLYHWRINPKGITHSRVQQQQEAALRVLKNYRAWYLASPFVNPVTLDEIRTERKLTGRRILWKRKIALQKLFRQLNRKDLVQREWRYLWHMLV